MKTPRHVSGIVLAGGGSVRFGADKLAADVGGRPLIHWPIEALAAMCDEVVVVVGHGALPSLPANLPVSLRLVRDDEPGAGPLAGLVTGLAESSCDTVVAVAGDMPGLIPGLLRDLARRTCAPDIDAAALHDGDAVRPLPMALRRETALATARRVRDTGGSSLRALLLALHVDAVTESEWRPMDPAGSSLFDVDRPEDLARARALR